MYEVRLHGRGGQGAAKAAEMLTAAINSEGKYASSFPMFGFERRGAPVMAFLRFDTRPTRVRTRIYNPHALLIFDPMLKNSPEVYTGLQPGAVVVMNTAAPLTVEFHYHSLVRLLGTVDATKIAVDELGFPATNTCMLGAFAATTGWVKLESLQATLSRYFSGQLLERNLRCLERGFREARVQQRTDGEETGRERVEVS